MVHNDRCEFARNPHCVCSCGGKLHGTKDEKNELNVAIGERYLTTALGGEVETFMKEKLGKTMRCLGTCNKNIVISELRGYPHTDGLADAEGKKWWVYVHCDTCNYDTSFGKIDQRIEQVKLDGHHQTLIDEKEEV
jgi:hypothetical protein